MVCDDSDISAEKPEAKTENKIRKQVKIYKTSLRLLSENNLKLSCLVRNLLRLHGAACAFCCRREKRVVFRV